VHERATAIAWEKEKTITRHLEHQLTTAQGIAIPQDDVATHIAHLHAQAAGLQNIRSVVTIVLEPSSPDYKRWRDLMLITLRRYTLNDHVLSDITDPSVYCVRLDNIVVTWILGILSPELHEIVREPTETAHQVWLTIEAQFTIGNRNFHRLEADES
jgi:hypothetical protein